MLNISQKLMTYLKRSTARLAALVGVVGSVLSDEKHTLSDWIEGALDGTPGADFPSTTLSAQLASGGSSATVASTSGFTVGSATSPGRLVITDGENSEVVSYTGSTATTFTGLARGLLGTTAQTWSSGATVFQLLPPGGSAPDYDLEGYPRNWTQHAASGGPSARVGARMVRQSDGKYYLFGGHDGTNYKNDLWRFDPSNDTWTQLTPTGGPPTARAYHVMGTGLDAIWISIGQTASGTTADTWKYTISSNSWSTGAWSFPGSARHSAMFANYGVHKIFVTGGISAGGSHVNATYLFDTTTGGWEQKTSSANSWGYGAACYMNDHGLFMVVGVNVYGTCLADAFDPILNVWKYPNIAAPPANRKHPTLVYDKANKTALLFGGESHTNPAGNKELWSYDKSANAWTQRESYSREGRTRHVAVWEPTTSTMFAWGGATSSTTPTWPTYSDPMRFRYYWEKVGYCTGAIDLGETPAEAGYWILEDVTDTVGNLSTATYTAEYSDDGSEWTDIGEIRDGDDITELHRYWRVHVTLMNYGHSKTARVQRIDANHDVVKYYALADRPVGDYPPIVSDISALTSDADPVKCSAKIGSVSVSLLDTGNVARKLVTDHYLRGKTVKIKIGVCEPDFAVADFALALKGRVEDWRYDGKTLTLDVVDFLGDMKRDIPEEDDTGVVTALVYNDSGIVSNPIDIMLDILKNRLDVPDRDVDSDSFELVKADASIAGWKFDRTISSPTDAYELMLELCRHIGAALIPRENGKIALKMLRADADPDAVWNERDQGFRNVRFHGQGASIRNWVSAWWNWDGSGDEYSDYEGIEVAADADSITNWGRVALRTKSKWLGDNASPYNGDDIAAAISSRMLDVSKNGVPTVDLETNMSAFPAQVGDLVRVRTAILEGHDEYRAWQREHDRSRTLEFVASTGRYSIPYLARGCSECVDMKWWVTKKQVNFAKGTIKWELSRAREIPLSKKLDSQDDFQSGWGERIDTDTVPGSVVIALDGASYFANATYAAILDVGQQPERDGAWVISLTKPTGTDVSFVAWASETGHFKGEELPLGSVANGAAIALKTRFYKVEATLSSNGAKTETPRVNTIEAKFANG